MSVYRGLSLLVLGAAVIVVTGCATQKDLQGFLTKEDLQVYSTKDELRSLRTDLLEEIRKNQGSARAAERSSAASAAAAQRAAENARAASVDARVASDKADAIFRQSTKK